MSVLLILADQVVHCTDRSERWFLFPYLKLFILGIANFGRRSAWRKASRHQNIKLVEFDNLSCLQQGMMHENSLRNPGLARIIRDHWGDPRLQLYILRHTKILSTFYVYHHWNVDRTHIYCWTCYICCCRGVGAAMMDLKGHEYKGIILYSGTNWLFQNKFMFYLIHFLVLLWMWREILVAYSKYDQ